VKPYFSGGGVDIYLGDCRDIAPSFTERGVVICDAPYSDRVHSKRRAGARKAPLRDGNGRLSKCAISRAADLGFESLTPELRTFIAAQSARLGRFSLQFSDTESHHLWREDHDKAGLEHCRVAYWRKIGGTPQFTGDRPASAVEAITIAAPAGRKHWNGGGKHGWYERDFDEGDFEAFVEFGGDLVYEHLTVIDRRAAGQAARVHTTQKPEGLMIDLVEDFSDPGETVYDFTCGFGTTAIGALKTKGGRRRCVLVEKQEKYVVAAAKRIEAHLRGGVYGPAEARGQKSIFDLMPIVEPAR
jgi:site-specific DNA-methyltransferase (adenine-specific)